MQLLNPPDAGTALGALGDLLEDLTDGVVVIDRDRRIRAFNSRFAQMFAIEPGALSVGDTLETLWRVIAARGGMEIGLSSEEAIQRRLAMWGTPEDRHERRFLANGRVLDILRSHTETGDIVAVHADVTEALRRERELEMQRIYMASILDNITDGVALVDATGHYIAFNRRFLEQFDIDPGAVQWGMHIDALYEHFGDLKMLPEAERAREIAERRAFITDPGRAHVERHLANGRVLDISKALLPSGGCVLTIRDKTEDLAKTEALRAAQAAAERSSLHKSQFLARMSHEMRTPLNGVLGIAALLGNTALDTRQKGYVELIASSGDMLLRLIDDVLDLSRIEAGSIEFREAPFRICEVMRECAGLVTPVAEQKGLALTKDPSPVEVPVLVGDRVRVKQVVLNLLSNAVKFTTTGGVRIGLRVAPAGGRCGVRIFVSDSGIGIPETEREAIFGQFYQIDGSETRGAGGAGLGLTITRRLVEAMDGRISVGAAPGGGSIFEVALDLPVAAVQTPGAA